MTVTGPLTTPDVLHNVPPALPTPTLTVLAPGLTYTSFLLTSDLSPNPSDHPVPTVNDSALLDSSGR